MAADPFQRHRSPRDLLLAPMPVLHINDQKYPLEAGSTRLGAPDVADIPVAAGLGVQAVVDVVAGKGVTIRRAAEDASIRINGVALGAEPTPLLHGDRLEIAGVQLRYADDEKGGATQFVSSGNVAELAARRGGAVATSGTGGRLVSLVDGKEYSVPATGLVIGREVGADVVVPLAEVSRRHAEIVPTAEGYRITDLSTNGVMVNGERVVQSRVLNRSDVIRVGTEEFRFYADVAKPVVAPSPATAPAAPAGAAATLPPDAVSPAAGAAVAPEAAPQRATRPEPAPSMRPAAAAGEPSVAASSTADEPPRPSGAPLTAEPPRAMPPRRPVPKPAPPPPAAGGRMPFWLWLLIVLAIVTAAFFVMG